MKKICFVLFLALCSNMLKGQIIFTQVNGQVSNNIDNTKKYPLPLQIQFSGSAFTGAVIGIWNTAHNQVLALNNKKLGTDISKDGNAALDGKTVYNLQIDASGKYQAITLPAAFAVKVNNAFFQISTAGVNPPGAGNNPVPTGAVTAYSAGYIYYDAIKLKGWISAHQTTDSISNLLKAYGIDSAADFRGDHFLNQINQLANAGGVQGSGLNIADVFSSLGGSNVTSFANGLAGFLVARGKQELTVYFFRQLQKFLNTYPEVRVIFPQTCSFLGRINAYQYASMLTTLRASFQVDINNLSRNLLDLRDMSDDSCKNNNGCKVTIAQIKQFLNVSLAGNSAVAALILANNINQGKNIAVAIDSLANDPVCKVTDTSKFYNVANAIRLLNLLSQSLISKEKGATWVNRDQINFLINDETTLKIYLGLLYAKDHQDKLPVTFKIDKKQETFGAFLNSLADKWSTADSVVNSFKAKFRDMANMFSEASQDLQDIKAGQNSDQSILSYTNFTTSAVNSINLAMNLLPDNSGSDTTLKKLKKDVANFSTGIDAALNCVNDIKSKNYGALILNSSDLLAELLGSKYNFKGDYLKYGTFIATIVQAKSANDVSAAIDAAVLPVGSSSVKRENPMNIAINAFIGPDYGWEYLPALKTKQWSSVAGITAPVGVAFSWGNIFGDQQLKPDANGNTKGGKSISIFVSLIDVGALASYRLQKDSSSVSPQIKLSNIVSPGLFLYYGFGNSPISLGLGAQYGPQLRDISAAGTADLQQNYYFKFGFSLVVDIPLFDLHTKTKE